VKENDSQLTSLCNEVYQFCKERDIPLLLVAQLSDRIHACVWGPTAPDERIDQGLWCLIRIQEAFREATFHRRIE
jgi:hypothetical protein